MLRRGFPGGILNRFLGALLGLVTSVNGVFFSRDLPILKEMGAQHPKGVLAQSIIAARFPEALRPDNVSLKALDKIFSKYQRPVTFLGIGNSDADQIVEYCARKYRGVFILLEGKEITSSKNRPPNYVHLSRAYDQRLLQHMAESEHFDIACVWNIPEDCSQKYAKTLKDLAEHVLVKVSSERRHLIPLLLSQRFRFFMRDPNSGDQFLLKFSRIRCQKRTQWFEDPSNTLKAREIVSTFERKILKKKYGKKPVICSWKPGMNLVTFKMMKGDFPDVSQTKTEIHRLLKIKHPDLMPNNVIVQGNKLELIDFEDPCIDETEYRSIVTEKFKELMVYFVEEKNEDSVPQRYQDLLEYSRWICHPEDR